MKQMLLLSCLVMPITVMAETWPWGASWGLESQSGGAHWDTIRRSDSADRDIRLGEGLYFYGGAMALLPEIPTPGRLELRSRFGIKIVLGEGDGFSYSKQSYPLEVGVRYMNDCRPFSALRCGFYVEANVVQQFSAEYRIRGSQYRQDNFMTEPSYGVRAGWYIFYMSYWHQEYQISDERFDASSVNFGIEMPLSFNTDWGVGR